MKPQSPQLDAERATAQAEWVNRDKARERIRGLGRNDLCPLHEKKIKKCGCILHANKSIMFNGKVY